MRKIPTLFARDFNARPAHVLPKVTPGCAWVLEGEGRPTRKWDGVCTMLDTDGAWWARREVKPGKTPPANYVLTEADPETGKTVGWEPIGQTGWAKIHTEAVTNCGGIEGAGTYELLGPRVNRNPDDFEAHVLMPHGWARLSERLDIEAAPRDYDGLRVWLHARPYEGIVWWRDPADPHCDKVKLKARDFPRH